MEKKVTIGGKEFTVREVSYIEALEVEEMRQQSTSAAVKKLLTLSTGISEEEASKLSLRDGAELQKVINEVNDLGDFQKAAQEEKAN